MPERDMDGDVIDQADALMRRYRSFVARPAGDAESVPSADAVAEAEIPVLTDIVAADAIAPNDLPALLDALRDELDEELSAWLIEVLPAAVANASQQILAELDAKARNTLLPRLRGIVEAHRDKSERSQSL